MKTPGQIVIALILSFLFSSCHPNLEDMEPNDANKSLDKIQFPEKFDFSTTKSVEITLSAPKVFQGSIFEIYYKNTSQTEIFISKGTFDSNNKYLMTITLPVIVDSLFIYSKSIGLERKVGLAIKQNKATYDYGINFNAPRETDFIYGTNLKSALVDAFSYMGSYTANGYPSYLFQVNDHAWESLLSNLNQTLPEGVSVPRTKPSFMESGKQSNLVLKEKTKVFVTFAGEGTDLTSALGYFIYDGSKPTNLQHKIIFPNASTPGSGGSLHSGDKVLLGEFPANTVIGWFLVPNGWNKQNKTVQDKQGIYYSVASFNTESNSAFNQHMVLLKDIQNEVIVLGFEDTPRSSAGCDNDFNDAVFYITLDRLAAADLSNVNNTISPVDTDGDGIIDSLDQFPLDPNKAFNNGGGNGSSGSLAFEDMWPTKGDYDFNDLVVDYQFGTITDASNLVKALNIGVTIRNVGASYRNGFGIELPVSASSVDSVTGTKYTQKFLNIASNGVESGRNNAIIFAFDDAWGVKGKTLPISVVFKSAISPSALGGYPYNPFMIVNLNRGCEIHLPDYPPTSGANFSYFGQAADYSRPSSGLYYRSAQNLPWAINVTSSYAVPAEKAPINLGYLKFVDWAKSAGVQYPDWYLNMPGYRDNSYLN